MHGVHGILITQDSGILLPKWSPSLVTTLGRWVNLPLAHIIEMMTRIVESSFTFWASSPNGGPENTLTHCASWTAGLDWFLGHTVICGFLMLLTPFFLSLLLAPLSIVVT